MKNTITSAQLSKYKNSEPFSKTLNAWVNKEYKKLTKDIEIIPVAIGDPYQSFEEMKDEVTDYKRMKISSLYCENTIFGSAEMNIKFRAVHDSHHIKLNRSFSTADEFFITYKMLQEYRAEGLSQYDIDLLTIEMNGQICYYMEHGDFPANQREFTIGELIKLGY